MHTVLRYEDVCRQRTVVLTGCSAVLRAQEKVTPLGDLILDWGRATHVCLFMMRFVWLELDRVVRTLRIPRPWSVQVTSHFPAGIWTAHLTSRAIQAYAKCRGAA